MLLERKIMEIHKTYAFSADRAYAAVGKIDADSPPYSAADWGNILFAFYYYLAMLTSNDSSYHNVESKTRFDLCQAKFAAMLATVDAPWATLYALKVSANRIVECWNSTPRAERDTPAMRTMIEQYRYFDMIESFGKIVPDDPIVPFNALAIASRLNLPDRFPPLLAQLKRADKSYKDIEATGIPSGPGDPFYDDDFDNFRHWLSARPKPKKKSGSLRLIKAAVSSKAIWLFVSLTTLLLGTVDVFAQDRTATFSTARLQSGDMSQYNVAITLHTSQPSSSRIVAPFGSPSLADLKPHTMQTETSDENVPQQSGALVEVLQRRVSSEAVEGAAGRVQSSRPAPAQHWHTLFERMSPERLTPDVLPRLQFVDLKPH